MYKITIKGEARTEYPNLSILNGISCEDDFSEYFSKKYGETENEQSLIDKGVHNGYMHFSYENGKLWTITTYESPVELTEEEIKILADYTQGQWSDGIGEGFEQYPCMHDNDYCDECVCGECEDGDICHDNNDAGEVYVSPWQVGQVLLTEQIKIK